MSYATITPYHSFTITPELLEYYRIYRSKDRQVYLKLVTCCFCHKTFSPYEKVFILDVRHRRICASCLDIYVHDDSDSNPETITYIFVHPDGTREECMEVV